MATRKLLQSPSDTAAVVQVQMTGSNENTTAEIAQELGTVVANNALQASSFVAHWSWKSPDLLEDSAACQEWAAWGHTPWKCLLAQLYEAMHVPAESPR